MCTNSETSLERLKEMDPNEEEHYQATRARVHYIHVLMAYIACEWDGVPDEVSPAHAIFLNKCCDNATPIPNAAGLFAEKFLKNGA